MYFKDGAPSLADIAKAATWAIEVGTKQVPTNIRETTFGNDPNYPAMMEDISRTPFIGGPGYLVQVQVDEKTIFGLVADIVNFVEMSRTIEFGGSQETSDIFYKNQILYIPLEFAHWFIKNCCRKLINFSAKISVINRPLCFYF